MFKNQSNQVKKMVRDSNKDEIKKGPWKAEEDEVLINHVKKHGPRDWSSIRSKGLLQRTGKSCRLRWVNKLRPNLKNGCKFSAEEERVVIELQAQFGNKWAQIATYLPGRTDNDVKNFWSSRRKRLARISQNSASGNSKSRRTKPEGQVFRDITMTEASVFNTIVDEESSEKGGSCSSCSYIQNPQPLQMVPLLDLVKPELSTYNLDSAQVEPRLFQGPLPLATQQPELFPFSAENQAPFPLYDDPYQLDSVFKLVDAPQFADGAQVSCGQRPLFDPLGTSFVKDVKDVKGLVTPDSSFDDFPVDMFDQIDIPSPSESE